jgi:hypothetical protein
MDKMGSGITLQYGVATDDDTARIKISAHLTKEFNRRVAAERKVCLPKIHAAYVQEVMAYSSIIW